MKIVYDKNCTKLFISRANLISSRTNIDFGNHLNRIYFTDLEKKNEIEHF